LGSFKTVLTEYQIIVIFILLAVAFFIEWNISRLIKIGASTKELIDRYLFNFDIRNLNDFSEAELIELSIKNQEKYKKECQIQITNTGKDEPPGVKDWYTKRETKNQSEAIFMCQKENAWWDKQISTTYVNIVKIILLVVIISLFFLYRERTIYECFIILLSYSAILFKLIKDLIEYEKFKKWSFKSEVLIDLINSYDVIPEKDLITLQSYIFNRRKLTFIPLNLIHKLLTKELHDLWTQREERL
jgi:hypothetical protein